MTMSDPDEKEIVSCSQLRVQCLRNDETSVTNLYLVATEGAPPSIRRYNAMTYVTRRYTESLVC